MGRRVPCLRLLGALAAVASPSPARAEVLPAWSIPEPGVLVARVALEAELTRHRALSPVSLAPDLVYGVSDRIGIALHHSRSSQGLIGAGNGLCITAPRETLDAMAPVCEQTATGLGASVLARVSRVATLRLGGLARGPGAFAVTASAIVAAQRGRVWFAAARGCRSASTTPTSTTGSRCARSCGVAR